MQYTRLQHAHPLVLAQRVLPPRQVRPQVVLRRVVVGRGFVDQLLAMRALVVVLRGLADGEYLPAAAPSQSPGPAVLVTLQLTVLRPPRIPRCLSKVLLRGHGQRRVGEGLLVRAQGRALLRPIREVRNRL